ncbi:MAG TPA: ABC transporter ATP-binding protein [Verrucomicrobiota bacterium]|nr:ABC transporter ATP-binding protein [Verrucomicrobiota bacterium]
MAPGIEVGTDMEPVIQIRGLSKSFRSGTVALSNLHLRVASGEVYGLIGRNGAGKTTALRILMGLLRADQGEARVLGQELWSASADHRQKVAYLSQSQQLPDWMTLSDLERYSGHFYDNWSQQFFQQLARRWEIPLNQTISRMSGGNQRLAAIAVAMATRPEVLLLDEPAAGLDPIARRQLNQCLIEALLTGDGCTILLSTHLLGDLERLATQVGILDHGRIVADGAVEDWQRTMRRVQVVFHEDRPPTDFAIPGAMRSHVLGPVVTALARVTDDAQLAGIHALPGARVYVFPLTLEELFVDWFQESSPKGGNPAENFGQSG